MVRAWSLLLLSVIGLWLIAPAVALDGSAGLPACCRAKGKHHCSMNRLTNAHETDAGPSVTVVAGRCPFFPSGTAGPATLPVFLPSGSQRFFAGLVSHPAVQAQTEACYRISSIRMRQKRGPPSFIS